MYYRKYFSGIIDSLVTTTGTGVTVATGGGGGTALYYRSLKVTPVLCNAIVDVLQEIGLEDAACSLDPNSPEIYGEIFPYGPDKQGIHVYFGYNSANNTSSHGTMRIALCPDADVTALRRTADSFGYQSNNSITSVLSGNNVPYRFYVIVKGDPKSFLQVFVGNYNNPENEMGIFGFGRGKDCFGNDVVCYAPFIGNYSGYFFDLVKKTFVNKLNPINTINNSMVSGSTTEVILKGCALDTIALIPWIDIPLQGVTLENCYCVPTSLTTATTDQAFIIEGQEYWLLRYGRILAKCPTKLQR